MENLSEVIQDKRVKLTKPQREIAEHLLRGYRLVVVNAHYQSGGSYCYISNNNPTQSGLSYAGKVYKAFWGLVRNIQKVYPEFDPKKELISDVRGLVY